MCVCVCVCLYARKVAEETEFCKSSRDLLVCLHINGFYIYVCVCGCVLVNECRVLEKTFFSMMNARWQKRQIYFMFGYNDDLGCIYVCMQVCIYLCWHVFMCVFVRPLAHGGEI